VGWSEAQQGEQERQEGERAGQGDGFHCV
jgi:hypothetical protein